MAFADPEQQRTYNREYQRKWRAENRERVREINRKHEEGNRPKRRAKSLRYRHSNLDKCRANDRFGNATKRAQRLGRVPKWADLEAVKAFYFGCPPGMEVDHIVPLCGRKACGLHVLENLQYLTPPENRHKSNRC